MKCEACNGTGKDYDWLPVARCKVCNGSGFVNMTNEEWLSTLSTKNKAEALAITAELWCIDSADQWEQWLNAEYEEENK